MLVRWPVVTIPVPVFENDTQLTIWQSAVETPMPVPLDVVTEQ